MFSPTERAAQWLKEARAETEQAEEPQAYEWTPPVTRGKMVGTEDEARYKSTGRVATPEYDASGRRITKLGQSFRVAPEMTAAIKAGRREDEDQEADRLAREFEATRKAGLPRGATGIGEYELPELQQQQIAAQRVRESMGKPSRAEQGLRARPAEVDEAIVKALAAEPEEARMFKEPQVAPTAGVTVPTTGEPAPTRMMPEHPVPTGYQWPARGRYTAPGAPTEGFAGAEAPAEPTQTAQMAKTATTTARAGARTEAEPVAPTEPAKPKTLATVTDDELSDVKRRLEKMVEQSPEDKELADRLEMVNLEQRHRGEKMEYEDWAAMARAADTVEEQRKVLEMAKRARMPVEGLESLLTSPFERAKLKALGAKGEKGLFPEVARPLTSWEIDKKETEIRINQLKAQGLSDKQAADQALAEKRRADAGLARARTETEETLREPRYAAAAEKPFVMHSQEELNEAKRQEVLGLLPNKIEKLKAEAARAREYAARARRGGAGGRGASNEYLKWAELWRKQADNAVDNARASVTKSKDEAIRLEGLYENAINHADMKSAELKSVQGLLDKIPPYDPKRSEVAMRLATLQAESDAAVRARANLEPKLKAAQAASVAADTALKETQNMSNEGYNNIRAIWTQFGPGGKLAELPAVGGAAPAAPAARAKPATAPDKVPAGVTLTGNPQLKKPKGQEPAYYQKGSDGTWYRVAAPK